MKLLKKMWQFGLCALFAFGLSYGFSAHATEQGECEEGAHKIQETQEAAKQELQEMKGSAQEEMGSAQEEIHETQEDVKEEPH